MWQLDIILLCAVIVAIDPGRKLYVEFQNWQHRRRVHRNQEKTQ